MRSSSAECTKQARSPEGGTRVVSGRGICAEDECAFASAPVLVVAVAVRCALTSSVTVH
jgi:hypothetical protein